MLTENTPKITLAIVDDHTLVRETVRSVMTSQGFEVTMNAVHGLDFLEQIDQTSVLPDVCLMDLSMPVMNGIETIQEIRRRGLKIKTVVFSLPRYDHQIKQALEAGADGFVGKGASPLELKRAIEEAYYSN